MVSSKKPGGHGIPQKPSLESAFAPVTPLGDPGGPVFSAVFRRERILITQSFYFVSVLGIKVLSISSFPTIPISFSLSITGMV